jgi:hypothetical protein
VGGNARKSCLLFDFEEDPMTVSAVLDSAGRRRSPAILLGFHAGRSPRNKGMRYPADPPTVEEVIAAVHTRWAPVMSAIAGYASEREHVKTAGRGKRSRLISRATRPE